MEETGHPSITEVNFQEKITPRISAVQIYTDGSKTEKGVGAAIYEKPSRAFSQISLLPKSSIYTAELTAIHQAIDLCLNRAESEFLIFTFVLPRRFRI